jgi:hypothetical protein
MAVKVLAEASPGEVRRLTDLTGPRPSDPGQPPAGVRIWPTEPDRLLDEVRRTQT